MDIKPYRDHTVQLFSIYEELNLQAIDDFHVDPDDRWDGKSFFQWFSDIARSTPRENEFLESDFKNYDDFVVLSGDIKFCAGMLHYLFKSTTKLHDQFGSDIMDRRYVMHASFGFQSVYQFWDRIGDLLWHYFPTGIKPDQVYTGRVLNNLPALAKTSEYFIKLEKLYQDFKEHFEIRHDVVHNYALGTKLTWERRGGFRDYKLNKQLLSKIASYKSLLTESLVQCIDALELTLRVIELKQRS